MWQPWGDQRQTTAICTATKPYLLDKLRKMAPHVLRIWVLARALDCTDCCSPTDNVKGQQAWLWCWKLLQTKDWKIQPCWQGNNTHTHTHTHTQMHKDTHALKLLDAFPLSSPPPPLSCLVFHRCGYSCALSIFLSSFSPPPLRLRFPEQKGCFSFSCYIGSIG